MKKFLCLAMVAGILCMSFAGCSIKEAKRKADEIEDAVELKADMIEDQIEEKTGKIENAIEGKTDIIEDAIDEETDIVEDKIEKQVKKFDDKDWNIAKEKYDAAEVMAFIEASEKSGYTADEIKNLVNDIDKYYQEIKDGVTSENEQIALTMYKAACTLDRMDDKHKGLSDHPVVELGDEARDIMEDLYNTNSSEYKESKKEFERVLEEVKNYNDKDWEAVEGKL